MDNRTEATSVWMLTMGLTLVSITFGLCLIPYVGFVIALVGYLGTRKAQKLMYSTGNYLDMGDPIQILCNPSCLFKSTCFIMRVGWGITLVYYTFCLLSGARMSLIDHPY